LVSALRLSDTLVSTVVDPATNAAAPRAKTDRGDAPTATDNQAPAANSPPALFAGLNLAGLNLVVNVPPASAAPAAILPPVAAAAQSTAHIPQAPSSPPVQHPPDATISAAPQNVAPSAVPPEVPATIIATAATATLELSSLAQTVSVSEKPASPVDARTTIPRAAIGDARLPAPADGGATVTQVAAVLPTNPDGSGYSPTPTQVDSQAAPLSTNQLPQQPTTTPIASGTAAVATALPQNPPATISVSSVPFSNTSAITVTSPIVTQAVLAAAPEKGSAAQPALGSDSVPSAPQPGTANPDLASFAAAPASLQAHAAIFQAVPPASAAGIHSAQVIEQVAYALQATHSSGQNMQLQLSPPDLGSLQISVSVHEGVLSARLEAQNPTTQQILVDNLSQLKNSLTQQGVAFDRIDVRLAGSQTGSGSSGTADSLFGQQQQNAFSWEQNPAFESTETDAPAPANPQSPGRFPRIAVTSLDVTV
jgi:subtilase-type serine protease